jgi:hypothetical protein
MGPFLMLVLLVRLILAIPAVDACWPFAGAHWYRPAALPA